MMKARKSRILFVVGCFLLMVLGLSANIHKEKTLPPLPLERIQQLREHYPIYNDDPPNYSFSPILYQEIIERSETVVVAESIGGFPEYEADLRPGMKIVTGNAQGGTLQGDKYYFSKHGTYYIVDNDYVLSAVDNDFSKYMNGKTVSSLVEKIKVMHGK